MGQTLPLLDWLTAENSHRFELFMVYGTPYEKAAKQAMKTQPVGKGWIHQSSFMHLQVDY